MQIQALNYLNQSSGIVQSEKNLVGKTKAPEQVQNFTMIPDNGFARLQWTQSEELDVVVGGLVRIRHSPLLSGVTWANSNSIHEDVTGTAKEAYVDLKEGTYLAKFVDSGGRLSINASLVEFKEPDLEDLTDLNTQTENNTFTGSKTNLQVVSGELVNEPDQAPLNNNSYTGLYIVDHINDTAIITTLSGNIGHSYVANNYVYVTTTSGNFLTGNYKIVAIISVLNCADSIQIEYPNNFTNSTCLIKPAFYKTTGTYLFANNPIDLGNIFSVKLKSEIKSRAFFPNAITINDMGLDFDPGQPLVTGFAAVESFTGDTPNNTNVQLYLSTTQQAPANNVWSTWRPFNNAEFVARAYKFKAVFNTNEDVAQIALYGLKIISQMKRRTINGTGTTVSNNYKQINFANAFQSIPVVGITFSADTTGQYYKLVATTSSYFRIEIYNSSNTRIAKAFSYAAIGFGKQL